MRRHLPLLAAVAITFGAMVAYPAASAPSTPQHYTVEAGETYRSIAAKLGLDETALACANRTSSASCPSVTSQPGTGRIIHLSGVLPSTTTTTQAVPSTSAAPSSTTSTVAASTTSSPPTSTVSPTTTTSTTVPNSTTTTTTVPAPPPSGTLFSETFDTPQALGNILFEKNPPASGDPAAGMAFMGDHDMGCGNPFTYRQLNENGGVSGTLPTDVVWWCNGHFMTGMNTGGYITMGMSPKAANGQAMIFPATANKFCWDASNAAMGGRKWLEVAVISDDHYLANGGGITYQNPPFAINASPGINAMSGDDFIFTGPGVQYFRGQDATFADFGTDAYWGSSTDKATRFQNCLRDNGNGTITRTQARPAGAAGFPISSITGSGSFPAGPRVFILLDVTYNADKDQGPGRVEQPYTWHFDNINVIAS